MTFELINVFFWGGGCPRKIRTYNSMFLDMLRVCRSESLQIVKTPTVCYSVYGCVCVAGDLHMAGTSTRENGLKETITLKWCTPRTNSVGEQSQLKPSCFFEASSQKSFTVCSAVISLLFIGLLELYYCTGAYRISPTDVNSRPSSCLTNFLLNGR